MDEILTVQDVADFFKVSRSTVWRWCNVGKLPAFKIGNSWRVHRSTIEKIVGHRLHANENNSMHKARSP